MYSGSYIENDCKYLYNCTCTRCGEKCPPFIKYKEDNTNNLPCDMVGYTPSDPTHNNMGL